MQELGGAGMKEDKYQGTHLLVSPFQKAPHSQPDLSPNPLPQTVP